MQPARPSHTNTLRNTSLFIVHCRSHCKLAMEHLHLWPMLMSGDNTFLSESPGMLKPNREESDVRNPPKVGPNKESPSNLHTK